MKALPDNFPIPNDRGSYQGVRESITPSTLSQRDGSRKSVHHLSPKPTPREQRDKKPI